MSENLSHQISWFDREMKRFKEKGTLIPDLQTRLYTAISREWTPGRIVVDIGCSLGVGSNILSHTARSVWGIDVNEEAIRYATQAFRRPNLDFAVLDVEHPPMRELSKFEVITMSEVIEHLADVETGLASVKNFFGKDAVGFITAPNQNNEMVRENEAKHGYHIQQWTAGQFYELMTKHFRSVVLYSADKLNTWQQDETIDGGSDAYLMVAKVEGVL